MKDGVLGGLAGFNQFLEVFSRPVRSTTNSDLHMQMRRTGRKAWRAGTVTLAHQGIEKSFQFIYLPIQNLHKLSRKLEILFPSYSIRLTLQKLLVQTHLLNCRWFSEIHSPRVAFKFPANSQRTLCALNGVRVSSEGRGLCLFDLCGARHAEISSRHSLPFI